MSISKRIPQGLGLMVVCLWIVVFLAPPAFAYRICTLKGTVVDHGWRSMTVKSAGQCAKMNVGWRTKYIPNRRPCLGERVAVDFVLDEGFMKATKVVSLTPQPSPVTCYPPPPPSNAVCREVTDGRGASLEDVCPEPRAICSRTPPPHVRDDRVPRRDVRRRVLRQRPERRTARAGQETPAPDKPETKPTRKPVPEPEPDTPTTKPEPEPMDETIEGEVVASGPQRLSIRMKDGAEAPRIVNVKVGLETKFIPFRRPAVGEKVKIKYRDEAGDKFAESVEVVQ